MHSSRMRTARPFPANRRQANKWTVGFNDSGVCLFATIQHPSDRMTNTCENMTFARFATRAVINEKGRHHFNINTPPTLCSICTHGLFWTLSFIQSYDEGKANVKIKLNFYDSCRLMAYSHCSGTGPRSGTGIGLGSMGSNVDYLPPANEVHKGSVSQHAPAQGVWMEVHWQGCGQGCIIPPPPWWLLMRTMCLLLEYILICRSVHIGLGQGQGLGPIVSYCASPIYCTAPVHIRAVWINCKGDRPNWHTRN